MSGYRSVIRALRTGSYMETLLWKQRHNGMAQGKLTIVQGDATRPDGEGSKRIVLPHVCNNLGGWGSGFVNAITARWGDLPRAMYKDWFGGMRGAEINQKHNVEARQDVSIKIITQTRFVLGGCQLIQLPNNIVLANMIGQHQYGRDEALTGTRIVDGEPQAEVFSRAPIRYGAVAKAMSGIAEYIGQEPIEIHCPKFGSDLAGGDWNVIMALIQELWIDNGINATVYEWIPK